MLFYLNISESAIERFGPVNLGRWAYLRSRCINGVLYAEWNERKARKIAWSRGKYYNVLKELTAAGLVKTDRGHYRLANAAEVRGLNAHSCKLKIRCGARDREVIDMVRLKSMEMAHRQVVHAIIPPTNAKRLAKRERIALLERGLCSAETLTDHKAVHLGSTPADMVRSAKQGYAPMNTRKLMECTGLGRWATLAWKGRCKRRGWITQENRTFSIPAELAPAARYFHRELEVGYRGKVAATAHGFKFHQAAIYHLNMRYSSSFH